MSSYSAEEFSQLKEKSKQRIALKKRLWKQSNKKKVAGYNSKYYENNHESIAEQKKVKYEEKKEQKKIEKEKRHLENVEKTRIRLPEAKDRKNNKIRSHNRIPKSVFDDFVLAYIHRYRSKGVDQKTEEIFKTYEQEGTETFEMIEAKIDSAYQKVKEMPFEKGETHWAKIDSIYKDAGVDITSISNVWNKLTNKHYNFLEKIAKEIGEKFICPSCGKDWDGKIYLLCLRCQANKKLEKENKALVRKRKPIDFTMEDLENGSDEEEFKSKIKSPLDKKTLPTRTCAKNINYE